MIYSKVRDKGTYTERIVYFKDKECTILHRENGPAIEYMNGAYKSWWINGMVHREDGPAIESQTTGKVYYLNNCFYKEQDYWEEINKIKRFGHFC